MKTYRFFLIGIVALPILLLLAFVPITEQSESTSNPIQLTLNEARTNVQNDISLWFDDKENYYYVNRGIEKDPDLYSKLKDLEGELIDIRYAKHWSLLNPKNSTRHVSLIAFGTDTLYSELK